MSQWHWLDVELLLVVDWTHRCGEERGEERGGGKEERGGGRGKVSSNKAAMMIRERVRDNENDREKREMGEESEH